MQNNRKTVQKYNEGNIGKYKTKNRLKRIMVERFDNRLLEIIGELSSSESLCTLLDAGCGEGVVANIIATKFPKIKLTGIDGASEAVRYANDNFSEIKVIEGNLYDLPFPDKSFDIVLCSEVLEHLLDYPDALEEIKRVAKKTIIITVPHEPWFCIGNLLSLHNVVRFGNPIDHVNHWTYASFKAMVHKYNNKANIRFYKSFPWQIAAIEL